MSDDRLLEADTHFDFGRNWSDYSRLIDESAIEEAEKGLLALVPRERLAGASWLDIGSGSGLHSLAAGRLGASAITALDIDRNSVETTRRVLSSHEIAATVEERSVFDLEALGEFDIVYSWGVLHHTGDMWRAVKAAASHVRPGGLFVIALYEKTPLCGMWRTEKRIYTNAPAIVRTMLRALYSTAFFAALLLTGRNPLRYIREYRGARGMDFWHDVDDWLGGYPYESASAAETRERVEALGFVQQRVMNSREPSGLLGTGCVEYVFEHAG